jgi:hypothetical protein
VCQPPKDFDVLAEFQRRHGRSPLGFQQSGLAAALEAFTSRRLPPPEWVLFEREWWHLVDGKYVPESPE